MANVFEVPAETKKENHLEHGNQKTEIVVMLGARLFQKGEGNKYPPRFPLINESAKEGMSKEVSGGDSRMRAIQQLYKEFSENRNNPSYPQEMHIFTTGGEESIKLDSGEILKLSRAEEARKKLKKKYGVSDVVLEGSLPSGGSTLGNAAAIAEWVKEHSDAISEVHDIEIVTNEFHIARAWIMFMMAFYKNEYKHDIQISPEDIQEIENILERTLANEEDGDKKELEDIQKIFEKYTKDLPIKVKPLIVEDILARKSESGREYARQIKNNELVKESRTKERDGIKDLLHGRYKVK